jgi:hypothetical protein
MGLLSKVKSKVKSVAKPAAIVSKVKSVAKPSTLAKVALAATGVGALTMGASALAAKKAEKAEYKINNWGPLESDPSKVSIKYSPALSIAMSDMITVSGTPFDGEYSDPEYRTRNEVYIKPATPVTTSGTGGIFKLKTSMAARVAGAASATKAGVRTTAKKTGTAVKTGAQKVGKAVGGVAGALWNKIKWYVYGLILVALLSGAAYLYMQYKARQALMGAAV